ncbi:MAG: hypothetical protein QOE46_2888 [Acidobacteriota bacterium]|jgi:hypothetical protein|nr:hypothetical protein [Acidobacteriota bacterium]
MAITKLPEASSDYEQASVSGRIFFSHGLPAAGLTVRVYHRSYGCAETPLGETKTGEDGSYLLSYTPVGSPTNLEVRAAERDGHEVSLSATRYDAQRHEIFNLVAPASLRPLAPEYARLKADLGKHLGHEENLSKARENAACQDISLLHRATRWDARLIALLAVAARLAAETRMNEAALYALFRRGMPTDKRLLAHVGAEAVVNALKEAVAANIVSLSDEQIAATKAAFKTFARKIRRASRASGAASSFADLLKRAGLKQSEQVAFENLYFDHRGTAAELWQQAEKKGISHAAIERMQLQGKLAYLTLNNAALIEAIQKGVDSAASLGALVDEDLYREDAWQKRILSLAGNKETALSKLIPSAYKGEKTADRLQSYSADLARKVRLSLPTRVVARMIETDELHLGKQHKALKKPVNTFLKNADGLGYSLGRVPINKFIKENQQAAFQGISEDDLEATTRTVKKLHRLYQITPTDEALNVALSAGFGSAYDVAAQSYETFIKSYGDKFASDEALSLEVATQFYRKAQQVASVTYNFFTSAKQLESAPTVYAISPATTATVQEAKNELIKHYPSMESLFGSLDYCDCEACRSVLSPAAYLVDLLQFIDPDVPSWNGFTASWKLTHNGEEYTAQHKKAYDALIERRPDLPHLPLTCENTNTALPYIDLVNEILEYYVANGNLDPAAVHDTGEATTPELLAEPQNILRGAYDKLKDARYPTGLPFDLWLDTVRRFCEQFGIPLWRVLEVFRGTENLFSQPGDTAPYDLAVIFNEYLNLSPSEYAIFTDADPLSGWHLLYGFDDPAKTATENQQDALTALASAKTLARCLGLSYKQLIDLVRAGFVNPRLETLVVLRKLGVEVEDVFRYKTNEGLLSADESSLTQQQLGLLAELKAFQQRLDALAITFPSFDAAAWLDEAWQGNLFDEVLVLADPDTGCDFEATTLGYADGTAVDALALIKINLFTRLWKKLGWTIEEIDRALRAFLPAASQPLTAEGLGEAFKTALVYMAHFKWLDERVKVGANRRVKLLTLWSNLPTTGSAPLYAQLFLTRSVLKQDDVFDDPLGDYLSQSGILIKDHLLALQAALSLTANDIASILADAGDALDAAALSLENVSLLYRYGLLAKALKISVAELISLKALSGLDPFKSLNASPLTTLEEDYPFTQTLRFINVAATLKESGLHVEDLDYLFRQRFDPVGKYRFDPDTLLALVRSLAAALSRMRDEQAVAASLTDDLLRHRLALVLTPETLAAFVGAINDTAEAEAIQENVPPAQRLDPKILASEPGMRAGYDDVLQRQRLTSRGLLLDAVKLRLTNENPSQLLSDLLDAAQTLSFTSLGRRIESVVAALIDTTEYHTSLENVQPADKLDPEALADEPSVRVAFDETRNIQRLTWRGLLLDAKKNLLNGSINSPVLTELLDAVQAQGRSEAEALISASLAMSVAALEFTAVETDVLLADKLNPDGFGPRIRVAYDDAPAWDSATTYQADDAVSFGGAVWVAVQANTNVEPVDGNDWSGPRGRRQSLTLQGLLSDAKKTQLTTANPSAVLSSLLDAVQIQTQALVQQLRAGLLASSDFDSLFAELPALGDANEDSLARLGRAVSPFVIRKLTRQLVVEIVAATLGADRDLAEALLTDASLLVDSTGHDATLMDAFVTASDHGVSAAFFASTDCSGAPLETRPVSTPDTADKPSGTNSARFEGYVEVPSAGPYRLFALSSKQDAEVELRFAHLPDPLLQVKAANDDAESSAFVELKPGISYAFTFSANNLNGGDATLLVQGENLPKGSLARLGLHPSEAVERVRRAQVLLSKSLSLSESLGLTAREVRHVLTHTADFDGVSMNKFPTREADDTPALANSLFGYFLRLVEYTRLKLEVAGGTDDLIGVFENARHIYPVATTDASAAQDAMIDDLCERIADLTRREFNVIREAADSLGFNATATTVGDKLHVESVGFAQEKGIRRLWDALQAVETLGVTVSAVIRSTGIISPAKTQDERFAIASDLRNTVKARYEPENWQRIAQPIFDKLRQRQRDALVAHIMHRNGFERVEELFEFFLIDPAMEPVVQTSRLRLAISSVQSFIQRALLNLELQVDPSAINSTHWEWMKRYRVWEANRKIFLFPENWLEPEFRDDKTHLFQELESNLLEGDVSNDLAEDAFFNYLKKLEELARLDIVAMYTEEKPLDPASNTVHVIGRTYSVPHRYFYRRYQYRMWTPWEPVPVEMDGDHIVAVIWRQRLHLFWVTFIEKAKLNTSGDPIKLDMQNIQVPTAPARQVDVQLSWSEYFQGQWTTRETSGFSKPITVDVSLDFHKRDVFIFAVKEYDKDGEESAVRIQLSGEVNMQEYAGEVQFTGNNQMKTAFRVVNKHSAPKVVTRDPTQPFDIPYTKDHAEANHYVGDNSLEVSFVETFVEEGGVPQANPKVSKEILRKAEDFSIIAPGNLPVFVTPEFGPLVNPFFFQDRQHTFFVEPTLTEQTFVEWEDWIVKVAVPDPVINVPITVGVPLWLDPGGPVEFDPLARFGLESGGDWLTIPQTLLQFDGAWVGVGGGVNVQQLPGMSMTSFSLFTNGGMRPTMIDGGGLGSVALKSINAGSKALP